MRATVACLVASCLLVSAAGSYRHVKQQGSQLPALPEETQRQYGRWRCVEPPHVDRVLRLEVPRQPLIVCAAASAWAPQRSFVLTAADGAAYRCRYCSSRRLPPPLRSQGHPHPQPERQCRLRQRTNLPRDPSGGKLPYRRLDGVACHRAFTMGCHNGYRWCHGSCCRRDSFFFYPDFQPKEKINSRYPSQRKKNVNVVIRRVVADGPVNWAKMVNGTFVVIE